MTPIRPVHIVEKSTLRYLPHVLVIMLVWALVMTRDYYEQVIAECKHAESWKAQPMTDTWSETATYI